MSGADSTSERERLLAQFQRGSVREKASPVEASAVLAAEADETYVAFKPTDRRQLSLHIRPASEAWQWVKYSYLLHISADTGGTRLDLVFSFLLVTVTGRNLLEVGDAIAKERCGLIQQFDAAKWARPADTSAAYIDAIVCIGNTPAFAAREKAAA